MKKLGSGENNSADRKSSGKLKDQIFKYLRAGKNKILSLERQMMDEKNPKKLMDRVDLSKEKLRMARRNFDKYEKAAEKYIEKNPKKAVAMAVAAGVLAGSLWSALKKKTAP